MDVISWPHYDSPLHLYVQLPTLEKAEMESVSSMLATTMASGTAAGLCAQASPP